MATKTTPPNRDSTMDRAHAADGQEKKVTAAAARRKTSPKKAKDEGLLASLCALVCDHQLGTSGIT